MGFLGVLGDLGSDISSIIGGNSANSAIQQGISNANATVTNAGTQALNAQNPIWQAGQNSLGALQSGLQNGQYLTTPYNYQMNNQYGATGGGYGYQPNAPQQFGQQPQSYQVGQFNFQQNPAYGFQQQQGAQGINNSAASQGNMLSGATQKALGQFSTNLANQSYNTAYNQYLQGQGLQQTQAQMGLGQYNTNRQFTQNQYLSQLGQYNTNRQTALGQQNTQNQLGMQNANLTYQAANQQGMENYGQQMGVAGMGQQAGNQISNINQQMGSTLGNLNIQSGNANAANAMNTANAFGNMFGNLGSAGLLGMFGGSGGSSPSSGWQTGSSLGLPAQYGAGNSMYPGSDFNGEQGPYANSQTGQYASGSY